MKTLNRRDRVNAAVNIFYMHLALYFQRLAWLLEEEFDACRSTRLGDRTVQLAPARRASKPRVERLAVRGHDALPGRHGPFAACAGMTDGAVTSYREQNRRQLLLPANLSVLGAARRGDDRRVRAGRQRDGRSPTWRRRAAQDADLEAGSAKACHDGTATVADLPGRSAKTSSARSSAGRRTRNPARGAAEDQPLGAARHGRDIVHRMVHRGGRGYISSRGRASSSSRWARIFSSSSPRSSSGIDQMPFRQFLDGAAPLRIRAAIPPGARSAGRHPARAQPPREALRRRRGDVCQALSLSSPRQRSSRRSRRSRP